MQTPPTCLIVLSATGMHIISLFMFIALSVLIRLYVLNTKNNMFLNRNLIMIGFRSSA